MAWNGICGKQHVTVCWIMEIKVREIKGGLDLIKKKDEITIRSSAAEYLTYVASVGDQQDSIEMRYEDENIWLTQKMMATLYDVALPTINEHIKKIYTDSELEESATIRNFRIVQTEGSRQVTRDTKHYSLQMIIAVGFKVNSERAVQFRKWVNQIAKDYTIKGWVMDDERLKRGTYLTEKYFDEQLERIREIRASERKFYQKITDLYATAIDYDKNSVTTRRFYATVQNKMHYAVHGHTAAELIVERANHTKEHMLSAFEWNAESKTMLYGQADYPYGRVLSKPEITEGNPIRLYTREEITDLFAKFGMQVRAGYADYSGAPSSGNAIQLLICFEKIN